MRFVTWNVNSIRQRLPHLLGYLEAFKPDVLCLQELKCMKEAFPFKEIEELGYNALVVGQKTFNGVALLSRFPLEEVSSSLPGNTEDLQARYLEALISKEGQVLRIVSLYAPNGNPVTSEKYPYKQAWMKRLIAHMNTLLTYEEPLILGGDFNVIPEPQDVYNPEAWIEDALFLLSTRQQFRALMYLGFTDPWRMHTDEPHHYTFWDYTLGRWPKDQGLRIDHFLLSPEAADRFTSIAIDKSLRGEERPSDHVPVRLELAF